MRQKEVFYLIIIWNVYKKKKKILRSQQRFKSEEYNVYTEEINKTALSCNGDKRLISYGGITTYPYGIRAAILCEQELLSKVSRKY